LTIRKVSLIRPNTPQGRDSYVTDCCILPAEAAQWQSQGRCACMTRVLRFEKKQCYAEKVKH
jgi:hypothetical protein